MRNWIILGKEEAEQEFWKYITFPTNFWDESAYEIRAGRRNCKGNYDCFIEKSAFSIFYNPFTDKFRLYTSLKIPKTVKVIDPDYLEIEPELYYRIEKYSVNGKDFLDRLVCSELV